MICAKVLIDGSADLSFDYLVTEAHAGAQPGCRVEILLRNRPATGTILSLGTPDPAWEDRLKPILRLIDPEPLVSPDMLEMGKWISEYYAVSLEQIMHCLLPETTRQEKHEEKTQKRVTLVSAPDDKTREALEKRAPKQAGILAMLQWAKGEAPLSDLGGSEALAAVRSLEKKGFVSIRDEAVHRDPDADQTFVPSQPIPMNKEQTVALELLLNAYRQESPKPQLLHGVTGSGKTEVYLQLVEKVVSEGKSALILVPEISLTPQTVQRFKSRFTESGMGVAVLHSLLSQGERFDEWHRIRRGEARIVIGARSAVFAPLQNLGVIIVDEEHDGSYKQESAPRYHGRDVAVLRGYKQKALVVLGSATPSLESFLNVKKEKYDIIRLSHRADHQSMPLIRVIDMRLEAKKNNKSAFTIVSDRLRAAIDQRLREGEQSILFLNRRGFARSLQCPDCGHVMFCPHCTLAMTYHRTEDRLICHMCDHQELAPRECPECHSFNILLQGYGTQKVEEVLHQLFPSARMERIDADISKRKNAVRDILNKFRARKLDMLLGTQMIAKGLDFPGVTLVGILNADLGLHIPDFRAGERTFQLLTQVAGRAGRGDLEGEVIIQTFTPHSPSIQFARHHDCDGFVEQELQMRSQFDLPPYSHMLLLTCRSPHERRASFSLETLHRKLKELLPSSYVITDPLPAPITKAHGQFRFQLSIKGTQARIMADAVKSLLDHTQLPEDVTAVIDVDPLSFF